MEEAGLSSSTAREPVVSRPEVYELEDTTGVLDRLWASVRARDAAPRSGTATYRVGLDADEVSWAHGNQRSTGFAARFRITPHAGGARGTLVVMLATTDRGRVRARRPARRLRREVRAALNDR